MNRSRLLIADDDEIILATFGAGLRDTGYEVIEAGSGEKALEEVAKRSIDLAILDIDMPGLSGIETARVLKALKVPVIFLSAYEGSKIVNAAVAEGALGYIIKPIDVEKIIPTIKAALKRAQELRTSKESEDRLGSALDTGKIVNVAVGMLMERHQIGQSEAFGMLRNKARSERRKVRGVASEMITAWETLNKLTPGRWNG